MSSFAWPLCICAMIVAVVGILSWRFPKQTGELIGRITSIGAGGVKTNPPAPVATQEVKDITKLEQTEELLKVFDNQLLVEHEGYIREAFLKNINDPAGRERILLRHLAWMHITYAFEATYNSIWGSQIHALQALNETGPNGMSEEVLNVWYEIGKAAYPERYANYPFESWLNFLHSWFLTELGTDHLVRITSLGNEFLVYLVRNKYTMNKAG